MPMETATAAEVYVVRWDGRAFKRGSNIQCWLSRLLYRRTDEENKKEKRKTQENEGEKR